MSSPVGLVVASYNIRRGCGVDGRRDLSRIARVVSELDAAVVALQEVDSEVHEDGFTDQLEFLAAATGMRAVAGPALRRDYGGYGNGVLTRLRVVAPRRYDISVAGVEPRGVLEVELDWAGHPVTIVTTHLGRGQRERRRQCERLLELLRRDRAGPLVLLGDFNEWSPWSRIYPAIDDLLGRTPLRRSFPSWLPLFSLDRIWAGPPARVREVIAVRTAHTRVASDHLPVLGRITLG